MQSEARHGVFSLSLTGDRPVPVAFPCPLLGEWGRRYLAVVVLLHVGPERTVRDVRAVASGPYGEPAREFFEARPGLREPVGLAAADAEALMRSAGFACFPVSGRCYVGSSRPYLFCAATGKGPPGGDLVGVRLFYDEAGVVRDTELVRKTVCVIRLFGKELPSDEGVIRDELRRLLPPGTPRQQAVARLREHGLEQTKDPENYTPEPPRKTADRTSRACCAGTRPVVGRWGRSSVGVRAVLKLDARDVLTETEVHLGLPFGEAHSRFFEARPDLTEPVGQPLAEAEARMRAAGFRCTRAAGAEPGGRGREHLLCEARDDRILFGGMARVRLFYDAAGVVRDSDLAAGGRWFDAERAMLPWAEDPAEELARRALLFPVHVTSRYAFFTTLFTLAFTMRMMAMPSWR
jgi:hypothetical protein